MIKLIKKQQGLPFLLALGVMFILSSSFLAVQLWSDEDGLRGAAAALEAPLIPPNLNAPTIVPPPAEKPDSSVEEKVSEETVRESAKVSGYGEQKSVEAPVVESATVEAPVKLEKPEEALLKPVVEERTVVVSKAEPKKAEPKKAEPKKVEPKKAELKKIEVVDEKPEQVLKGQLEGKKEAAKPLPAKNVKESPSNSAVTKAEKDSRETARGNEKGIGGVEVERPIKIEHKSPRRAKVPTEIPPEWNWFQTPLKLEVDGGNVEIVPAVEIRPQTKNAAPAVSRQVAPIKKAAQVEKAGKDDLKRKRNAASVNAQKPFEKALLKMAKLKEKRVEVSVKTISKKTEVVRPASVALKRLQDMLQLICKDSSELEADVENEEITVLENSEAAENSEFEEEPKTITPSSEGDKSYAGSGSSFSRRVNELIRSGEWLRD